MIHTSRATYAAPDRLDVTRQSAGLDGVFFAPSWAILAPALRKRRERGLSEADWTAYREAYLQEMRASYREHRAAWTALLARERVTLVCYCTDAEHCHRTILARDILPRLGAEYGGEIPPTDNSKRLAIIGSRGFKPLSLVDEFVDHLPPDITVVSGGAIGPDTRAENRAKARGLTFDPFYVPEKEWSTYGGKAGPLRNMRMLNTCAAAVAFWTGEVRNSGTFQAFSYMKEKRHRPVWIVFPDGQSDYPEAWGWRP